MKQVSRVIRIPGLRSTKPRGSRWAGASFQDHPASTRKKITPQSKAATSNRETMPVLGLVNFFLETSILGEIGFLFYFLANQSI